ncbi:zinc finger, C2H2 type [Oesophagostomum dentatum]|uniref:Zinc finger, C2H2 type n=1 Tax=Oesophagostomum dentatum TaxID=61180 RepID=A0A0B1TGA2_OESDE|nr:zinc finger, C2H2 type [Oesophagostomum dentatum]
MSASNGNNGRRNNHAHRNNRPRKFPPNRPGDFTGKGKYELRFQNGDVITRYEKYLAHVCKLCKSSDGDRLEFPTFVALRHHMSSVHQLTYCHICTENIIQFSRERKTYTRDGLQRHIRAGDRDDKSLKGHPSCLFCDQRFFDEEFRYRHLRKEHFFCQFCESEGKHMNVFFKDHGELVGHYKEQHFLCEFEECKAMGIAFSNQIDLNLHKSKEHSKHRVGVGIDFQFSDRQLAGPSRTRREPAANPPPLTRRDKIALVPQEQDPAPRRQPDRSHPAEDFPALPAPSQQLPVASAWGKKNSAKKNFKSVIVGCKVPKNNKQLPQPDMWPDRPVTTPAREPEPEQWHEIPPKPRKLDKKERRAQQKALSSNNSDTVEEGCSSEDQQRSSPIVVNDTKVSNDSHSKKEKREEGSKQKSSATSKEIRSERQNKETKDRKGKNSSGRLPSEPVANNPAISSKSSNPTKPSTVEKSDLTPKDSKKANEDLSEVEKYVEESAEKTLTSTEAPSKSSSILDWFSLPSKSSIFANLSLANVLGTNEDQKDAVAVPPSCETAEKRPPSAEAATTATAKPYTPVALAEDAPPGFTAPVQDDVFAGPPPGFEGLCPDPAAPPGLSVPSTSRAVFSMAPFISNADLNSRSMTSGTVEKRDSEWSTVGAK